MAVSGHNGNNETLIGMSTSLGLSIFDAETSNEIAISQSIIPIEIILTRDKSVSFYPFQYVNVTKYVFLNGSFYLQNNFNITTNNASIHIELMPLNKNISYLIVLKLGYIPIINSSYADYTSFKFFCSSKQLKLFKILEDFAHYSD